jgi:HSP20 family protein
MLTTRWQPFTQERNALSRLQEQMNRVFDSFGLGDGGQSGLTAYPALNVWQDADRVYAEAELPGLSLQELEIYVTGGNQLAIKGERNLPALQGGVWHRQECGYGPFLRVLPLPVDVDANKVEARLSNGILTITMPKSEMARPKKIPVKFE